MQCELPIRQPKNQRKGVREVNTKEIGKTLEKQLELLSERAEKSIETDELIAINHAIFATSSHLRSMRSIATLPPDCTRTTG